MKVRPVDPSAPPDGGRTTESAPQVLTDRVRSLWQRQWQARSGERAEPAERARGGTRLNDWPQQRPDGAHEETSSVPASSPEATTSAGVDLHRPVSPREPPRRNPRQGRDESDPRQAGVDRERDDGTLNLRFGTHALARTEATQWPQQFDRLSQVMADVCGRRGKAPESWNVHVDLDPQLLPDTRLHLSASQHSIRFRFLCGDEPSQRLLSQNVEGLRTRIASEVGESRPFDIEIE